MKFAEFDRRAFTHVFKTPATFKASFTTTLAISLRMTIATGSGNGWCDRHGRLKNLIRTVGPVGTERSHHAKRETGIKVLWSVSTVQDPRHLALLALVQQRVVLECTQVAVPPGALLVWSGRLLQQRSLALQTGRPGLLRQAVQ